MYIYTGQLLKSGIILGSIFPDIGILDNFHILDKYDGVISSHLREMLKQYYTSWLKKGYKVFRNK